MSLSLLLSQKEVATALSVSESTVERLRRDGSLEWLRIRGQVRITRQALDQYLTAAAASSRSAAE